MKIAMITSRFPYPVEKGDKLRAFHQIKWLGQRHEVYLFSISHEQVNAADIRAVEAYCAGVHVYRIGSVRHWVNLIRGWLRGLPAHIAYFLDQRIRTRMQDDLIRLRPQHVYAQLIRTAEYVRILPLSKTLDYMDVFSTGAAQRAERGPWLLRPFFALEAKRLARYERSVYGDFTNHAIISFQDRERLPLPYPENVRVIHNGVDLEYFVRSLVAPVTHDLLFVGNMGYQPNIEAAEFLVRRIMPIVWKTRPHLTVVLAGTRPHRRVRALASARVTVTGWVADVRPYYAGAKLFVAPMMSGLGQQNKILEAMAMELPCITTPLVDRAIGGEAAGALLIAEDADTFASKIIDTLTDPVAMGLGSRARKFVENKFTWDVQNKALEELLSQHNAFPETETITL